MWKISPEKAIITDLFQRKMPHRTIEIFSESEELHEDYSTHSVEQIFCFILYSKNYKSANWGTNQNGKKGIALQDRKQMSHPVVVQGGCSNEVYNIMSEDYVDLAGYTQSADHWIGLDCHPIAKKLKKVTQ